MRKFTAFLCAAVLMFSFGTGVFAYSTPFGMPDPAEPGDVGEACEVN